MFIGGVDAASLGPRRRLMLRYGGGGGGSSSSSDGSSAAQRSVQCDITTVVMTHVVAVQS